jgi:D-alanyl-D-alanine carboxypeptidase (penicillin-binding protein 5/6)
LEFALKHAVARGSLRFASRTAVALLLLPALLSAAVVPAAGQPGGDVPIKSKQAIVMDVDTGAVLLQRNADELVSPASMSKLMLLVMLFRALRSGLLQLGTEVQMSEHAWRTGGAPSRSSAMFVPLGKTATVDEMLKGIVVQSGNDAAIAIAEKLGGSEAAYAEVMTEAARELGLRKSVFKNATGLYHPEHLMTVREIAILARHIITEFPEYYPLFGMREFAYRHHRFNNRNPLLGWIPGVDGLKTGFISQSGYGIVASAKQDNRRIIVAINGAATADERKDDARRLFDWGFKNFSEVRLYDAGEVVGHARIWGGERMYMPLTGKGEVTIVLPRSPANPKLSARIFYKGPLKPPLKKGEQVAVLRVTTPNDATSEVPLYTAEDVARAGFIRRGLDSLMYLATRWIP